MSVRMKVPGGMLVEEKVKAGVHTQHLRHELLGTEEVPGSDHGGVPLAHLVLLV